MNKTDLIKFFSIDSIVSKKEAKRLVNSIFRIIRKSLISTGVLRILNFGTFRIKKRAQRQRLHPRTGERIIIPATFVPVFIFSKSFKDEVKTFFKVDFQSTKNKNYLVLTKNNNKKKTIKIDK
uniref:DNA-binding protein Hu-like protein n=1 Tax=Cyanidium sp. THAL103 TaxID=3027999 RepID=A0A9Y1I3Y9_9RHOD|nr:DNA-binding protein Hu-like protein [Cyanidium sp. THAL103]